MEVFQDNLPTSADWDADWVFRLKALEDRAWKDVIRTYGQELRSDIESSIRRRGLPLDWAADVEQDTWSVAIEKISEFQWQSIDRFYHWLRVIALNRVRMMKRKHTENLSLDAMEDDDLSNGISLDNFLYSNRMSDASPEQKMLNKERVTILEKALRALKPRDREILLRRMIDGETPRDLAPIYGLEARSVSMIILRAKQLLERLLAESDLFDDKEKGDENG